MDEFTEEQLIALFSRETIAGYRVINTSHGATDFRETILAEFKSGDKLVIKAAENAFTDSERIHMWRRCIEEYRNLGYYCPRILAPAGSDFPTAAYKGHKCIVYAEEYSPYESAEKSANAKPYRNDAYLMTAKIATRRFDYTDLPSAYCLFDTFGDDETDEVTENALEFQNYAKTLPERSAQQADRMFRRWEEHRAQLKEIYPKLPTSVFQADFNDTNALVDQEGRFVGIFDFNLAGKDVFLNYLFREIFHGTFEEELASILEALQVVSAVYDFSEEEKAAAPLIYRCIKPLWYTRVEALKEAGTDEAAIQKCLDEMEDAQTREIDFRGAMG